MVDEEDSYCRLCAEPTPKTQLISPDDDVGLNSKIKAKMQWINIDVSLENNLPNSICFSCFDLLERTWSFLNNTRTAQIKLFEIFVKKDDSENSSCEMRTDAGIAGKPVNEDWEGFEKLTDVKPEIFHDDNDEYEQLQLETVDPKSLLSIHIVKKELDSDDDDTFRPGSDGFNSTDSDIPLFETAKKKVNKKRRKKCKNSSDFDILDTKNQKVDDSPLTWVDFKCVCGDCDTQCDNITLLRIHAIQIHSRCCLFKCIDCGKTTSSSRTFLNHVRRHKKGLINCCEYCNKDFGSGSCLTSHRKLMHRDALQMSCQSCGMLFDNIDDLKEHLIKYSKTRRLKKSISEELKCKQCNKQFKTRGNLQTHNLLHTERQRNFSCHICGKMFFTKGSLSTHIMTHDDNKPFKCEFCPLTFRARGNLSAHVSLHSGVKPFVCEQCGKSFRAKRQLKSHSIVHTDLMPYVCNFCKKTFRFKTRLNLHIRQHTGLKPYKCNYCEREFTNGSNYKKHMKRKHNVDTSRKKYNNIVVNLPNSDTDKAKSLDKESDA